MNVLQAARQDSGEIYIIPYCVTAKVTKFTIIDLEANRENEIAFRIKANERL